MYKGLNNYHSLIIFKILLEYMLWAMSFQFFPVMKPYCLSNFNSTFTKIYTY